MVMSCFVKDLTELFDVRVKLAGFFRCFSLVSNWQQIGRYKKNEDQLRAVSPYDSARSLRLLLKAKRKAKCAGYRHNDFTFQVYYI